MTVEVLLFGPERAAANADRVKVSLDSDCSCAALRRGLGLAVGALVPSLGAARFAVNSRFVPDSHEVNEGDEIALIGMVSGG
jgi:molybdopterin converting factor small subunit